LASAQPKTPDPPKEAARKPEPLKPEPKADPIVAKKPTVAYGEESGRVWALLRQRKYDEAEKLIAELAGRPELKAGAAADAKAAELLREFWGHVERSIAATMTGRFVVVAGAGGAVTSVKDGVISIKTAKGAVETRRVQQLTTPQAVSYSGLKIKAEPHARLLVGVFLLADGAALGEAKAALAKGGSDAAIAGYCKRWLAAAQPTVYTRWPFGAAEAKRRQEETAALLGVPVERDIDLGKGVKLRLVLIPAGEFIMGSPKGESNVLDRRGETLHPVRLTEPFWMGKYEVTQAQWDVFMGGSMSRFKGAQNPVQHVSWNAAQWFLKKANEHLKDATLTLPTEAQWEYVCRAGTNTAYSFEKTVSTPQAERGGPTRVVTSVGSLAPNAWGLHDMHGSVQEWCHDWYDQGYYASSPLTNPRGPAQGSERVLRGGWWSVHLRRCRSAARSGSHLEGSNDTKGFRVMASMTPSQ